MFRPVESKVDFPALEQEVLAWWDENDIPRKYRSRNDGSATRYSFIDGPITANNPMGVHHAWGRTYKDLFLRYKTMQGYRQRYQNGFDGQGLWIEVEVEKDLGFKSKREIEEYGIDRFVELCKARVMRFADTITRQSIRLGYWMDWDDSYHTMSDQNNYTIWHFLKECHRRGWVYQGTDVMPWCPRCGTGLSEHEIVTEGYKEIVHPGVFVRFPILEGPVSEPRGSLLIWTTTPWTLPANVAATVHPDMTYVKVRQGDDVLYLIKDRLSVLRGGFEVLEELPGRDLVGVRYAGPFDELPAQQGVAHRVFEWDEVSASEGTGVVHNAPGAGREDFALGKQFGLPVIAPLDESGYFIDGFGSLSGRSVFEVNDDIYASLRDKGLLYHVERYSHRYPVCWRCDTELVWRLVDEWFISMDELRGLIAGVTEKITWIPEFGKQRELDWLRNMDDWMISKKRYWGLALPIYPCECGRFEVIGSREELKARAVAGWDEFEGRSPHRPWIDAVKIECSGCGAQVSRIADVGNPWLDAGIVPFSTLGYKTSPERWRDWFPADWISESFPGQFRNWFYSLLTMSTVLEGAEPFRTVFSYALMRDEKGEEMHKSKGNAIWFEDAAERMGVDSMRWLYARHSPAANLNFGYGNADEVRRRFIIPLWNVYSFFVTYANIDRYDPAAAAPPYGERAELDRWILSELNSTVAEVIAALDGFEPDRATRRVEQLIEHLSNWYVRRSRRRFWKAGVLEGDGAEDGDTDKLGAYATLYECLVTIVRLLAPFIPFLTESMYRNLVAPAAGGVESVHLDSYPVANPALIDPRLAGDARLAMRLSSMGRAARSKAGIKVRQPLATVAVKLRAADESESLSRVAPQLMDELNVRRIDLIDLESEVLEYAVRPNMPVLGPKYGRELPRIASALAAEDPDEVAGRVGAGLPVEADGYTLEPGEVLVTGSDREGYSVASDSGYTVAVSTTVTPELASEGLARELVHRVQNLRRSAGFDIADYIVTYYRGDGDMEAVLSTHGEYVRQETLSVRLVNDEPAPEAYSETHEIDGLPITLGVLRHAG